MFPGNFEVFKLPWNTKTDNKWENRKKSWFSIFFENFSNSFLSFLNLRKTFLKVIVPKFMYLSLNTDEPNSKLNWFYRALWTEDFGPRFLDQEPKLFFKIMFVHTRHIFQTACLPKTEWFICNSYHKNYYRGIPLPPLNSVFWSNILWY